MIEFTLQTVTTGALTITAIAEYWRSRRGPLVLLALAVLHLRAALLTARWIAARIPGDCRRVYPQAIEHVRRMG